MKPSRGIIITLLVIPFMYVCIYTFNSFFSEKTIFIQGKTIPYENLAEMEKETQVTLIGKKVDVNKTVVTKDNDLNQIEDAYSISNFQIENLLENKTNIEIKPDDIIHVMEFSARQKNFLGITHLYQFEDYHEMKEGKKYLLYLDESRTDPGIFIIGAVNYGKIPLETKDEIGRNLQDVLKVHQEVKEKHEVTIEKALHLN